MEFDKILRTDDLSGYYVDWLDEDIVAGCMKCAEYLIDKHNYNKIIVEHKKLTDGGTEKFKVGIQTRNVDVSKVVSSLQDKRIVEDAGIAMGLLITQWLRPLEFIRVLKMGDGYDYYYIPRDSNEEELIEMTGTEIPGAGTERLRSKIRKFKDKHPDTSGYISVSCFHDKVQIHWGHRNDS
ncbi:MAG: hypothetical protein C5S48_01460 [Candidatus Methanogaster sp.]|nr:MAG: hypothetical protein C5S48_01460 [ANME-2 cluster archaeon]